MIDETPEKQAFHVNIGDWCIVHGDARSFFGKVEALCAGVPSDVILSPAYEYISQTALDPVRGIQRVRLIVPLEMMQSANRIWVEACSMIRLADLDDDDQREIESMRVKAEELRLTLRAQRSGIVTPRVGISAKAHVGNGPVKA